MTPTPTLTLTPSSEARLSAARNSLVSNRRLRDVGAAMGVAPLLLLPDKATVTDKMVADVVEALLGTIYLEVSYTYYGCTHCCCAYYGRAYYGCAYYGCAYYGCAYCDCAYCDCTY